nr:hypothetical protein [Cupriavidus sp. SK-3]
MDLKRAAFDAIALQRAAVDDRRTGGQGQPVGVDEAAAVAGNPGRVGDDQLRPATGDFDIAVKPAGIARIDFVENDLGSPLAQPGITLHPAAQLRLRVPAGVVENRPLPAHVELLVGVARNTGCTWGLDVDQGGAIRRLQHSRTLAARRTGIGHHLRKRRAARCDMPHDDPQGESQWPHCHDARSAGRYAPAPASAVASGDLGDGLKQAAGTVEDDAVAVLVHAGTPNFREYECGRTRPVDISKTSSR